MIVIIAKDVKYKNQLRKAHVPFNCDAIDLPKLQALGAWVIQSKEPAKESKKSAK